MARRRRARRDGMVRPWRAAPLATFQPYGENGPRQRSPALTAEAAWGSGMSQFYAKAGDEYRARQAVLGDSITAVDGLGADGRISPAG
jgi:hypothetical protein